MGNITVLTDSCASIPESLVESLCIQTVAYYIHRGTEVRCWQFTPVPARLDCVTIQSKAEITTTGSGISRSFLSYGTKPHSLV